MNFYGDSLQNEFVVPGFIVTDKRLCVRSKWLYGILAGIVRQSPYGQCFPSQRHLAHEYGASVRSIQKYLKKLEIFGYIAVHSGKDGETNTYELLPPPHVQVEVAQPAVELGTSAFRASVGCEKSAHRDAAEHSAKLAPVFKKEEKNTPLPPNEGEVAAPVSQSPRAWKAEALAAFDRLWAAWPIREARVAALRWWMRLWRLDVLPPLETILRLIQENQARNPRWLRGFVPFLVTWLKERRWEDAVSPTPAPSAAETKPSAAAILADEPKPVLSIRDEGQNPKPLGLQGEKPEAARTVRRIPEGAWRQLNAALAIWPGSLTDAELSRVRGLWMYLYSKHRLPAQDDIINAGKTANQSFSRWLHVYQQQEKGSYSSQVCSEAWSC